MTRRPLRARSWLILAAAAGLTQAPAYGLVGSSGTAIFSGLNINDYLGADSFYNAGYTGTDAVVANIEAGFAWNQQDALVGKVTQFIQSPLPQFSGTQLGEVDLHATAVSQTIVGSGTLLPSVQDGIAYGATLWSGAIATTWVGTPLPTFEFSWSDDNAFLYPYQTAMQTGINGRIADVVNSSWGNDVPPNGRDPYSEAIDALQYANHDLFVASAGNGTVADSVGFPATSYNGIAVGGLGGLNDPEPYDVVSSFSSRGPGDFYNPATRTIVPGVVPTVDLTAPAEDMTLAYYGGTTGGNTGGTDSTGGSPDYYATWSGTSFAAPIVSGGAALVVDAGYQRFGGGTSVDGRVVKAVLLNSADKLPGWTNNPSIVNGVITTTQCLDYNQGAGRIDLAQAFTQFTAGTTDVPGLGGGTVQPIGWDYGQVSQGTNNDYDIGVPLAGGSPFVATLDWDVDAKIIGITSGVLSSEDLAFDQLDLQLWQTTAGGTLETEIADADAAYNNVDHMAITLPAGSAYYALVVVFQGKIYDISGGTDPNSSVYGLAWSDEFPVPEPAGLLAAPALAALAMRRRRAWTAAAAPA